MAHLSISWILRATFLHLKVSSESLVHLFERILTVCQEVLIPFRGISELFVVVFGPSGVGLACSMLLEARFT